MIQIATPGVKTATKEILVEGALVAVAGVVLAFVVNGLSPRGLVVARDYFPVAPVASPVTPRAGSTESGTGNTDQAAVSPERQLAERMQAEGLQLAYLEQAVDLFRDPRHASQLVVFIDARDDQNYQEGHVPGAYQFDHYRAERHIETILPVCQMAEQIVIYCSGGDCEDSQFAARTLAGVGIPKERLFVFGGGMNEWETNGLPVEIGERNSGVLRSATP